MAYSFDADIKTDISFDDFINNINNKLIPGEMSTLQDCATDIQKLANNQEFLIAFVHKELNEFLNFQSKNTHSAQTLVLYGNQKFYFRVNIWPPLSKRQDIAEWQKSIFVYEEPHDHNFSFLTVGYFGGGYDTEIWEYDYNKISGIVGEEVDMKFLEKTSLSKGKAMIYRKSTDIHSQFAPNDYTVSLNVMPFETSLVQNEQFYFDLNKKTITGITPSGATGRYFITELASTLGGDKIYNKLEEISKNHTNPFLRLRCYDAMAAIHKEDKTLIWKTALKDESIFVTAIASKRVETN
jgi:hypothetical protein